MHPFLRSIVALGVAPVVPDGAGADCLHALGAYSLRNLSSNGAHVEVFPSPAAYPYVITDSKSAFVSICSRCKAHEVEWPLARRVLRKSYGKGDDMGDLVSWV